MPKHEHHKCISDALAHLEASAKAQGLRLTPLRRRVFEILLEEHRALGAYDVLERLAAEGAAAQPPIAYRALNFLADHGFAHRVESKNAFVACTLGDLPHHPTLLICNSCDSVTENGALRADAALEEAAHAQGFTVEHKITELRGVCADCRDPK